MFLNKCDLLEKKIGRGVSVKKHLPSYGERPNETGAVIKCKFCLCYLGQFLMMIRVHDRSETEVQGNFAAVFTGIESLIYIPDVGYGGSSPFSSPFDEVF